MLRISASCMLSKGSSHKLHCCPTHVLFKGGNWCILSSTCMLERVLVDPECWGHYQNSGCVWMIAWPHYILLPVHSSVIVQLFFCPCSGVVDQCFTVTWLCIGAGREVMWKRKVRPQCRSFLKSLAVGFSVYLRLFFGGGGAWNVLQ